MLEKYGITEAEYDDYAGHYKNVIEEIADDKSDTQSENAEDAGVDQDYELMAYSSTKIEQFLFVAINATGNGNSNLCIPEARKLIMSILST